MLTTKGIANILCGLEWNCRMSNGLLLFVMGALAYLALSVLFRKIERKPPSKAPGPGHLSKSKKDKITRQDFKIDRR
jgi:hypothetical protein